MTENTNVDDPQVAALLAAASAPAEAPLPGEAEALAAYRSVYQPRRRKLMSVKSDNAKLVGAAVFGGLVVLSGAAAAATGNLPGVNSHSHPAHVQPSHAPDGTQDGTDNTDTQSGTDTQTQTPTDQSTPNPSSSNGSTISKLAHELPQGHKGQSICIVASQGHCHAAQQSQAPTTHGQSGTHSQAGTHRQNTATTHGKAGTHGQASTHSQAGTHRQNTATTHGQSSTHSQSSQHS